MIHDQANQLRQLARLQPHPRLAAGRSPELIAVTGARHGVGTTTVSVNLAMALAMAGRRVILVDADLERGDVGRLCGITEPSSVIDVLSGRRSIHEVLVRGPVGVLVVPGVWAPGSTGDCSATAQQRLLNQLRSLAVHADVVVIDTGSARNGFVRRFWQAAETPLLVTTPEPVAIMDGYATIKVLLAGIAGINVRTLINRAPSVERAEEVSAADYRRLPAIPGDRCRRRALSARGTVGPSGSRSGFAPGSGIASLRGRASLGAAGRRALASPADQQRPGHHRPAAQPRRPDVTPHRISNKSPLAKFHAKKQDARANADKNDSTPGGGKRRYLGHPRQPIARSNFSVCVKFAAVGSSGQSGQDGPTTSPGQAAQAAHRTRLSRGSRSWDVHTPESWVRWHF